MKYLNGRGKKVYIAAPYTGNPKANVEQAMHYWHTLATHGYFPFCPHLFHFLDNVQVRSYKEWMEHCMVWLDQCDYLIRFPGVSMGADLEAKFAREHGIPVFPDIEAFLEAALPRKCSCNFCS